MSLTESEFCAGWWRELENLSIEVHGVRAHLHAESQRHAPVLDALARDFCAFRVDDSGSGRIDIELCEQTPWQSTRSKFPLTIFRKPHIKVKGWFNHRVLIYANDVVAETRTVAGRRFFWISGLDLNLMRESAYRLLLSALGEELDLLGFHRVHAFGFERSARRGILLAPSGRGKSALAGIFCLNDRGYKLYSDESPLLKGREIFAFPTRLSIEPAVASALGLGEGELLTQKRYRDKTLLPFPVKRLAAPGPVNLIFVAVPARSDEPRIVRRTRVSLLPALFASLVVGLGLAQMAEWMLRAHALPRLIEISLRRSLSLRKILFANSEFFEFQMVKDARANALCLDHFVQTSSEIVQETSV